VPWTEHAVLNDSLGFYIRLRMICVPGNGFAATYVWTRSLLHEDGKLNLLHMLMQTGIYEMALNSLRVLYFFGDFLKIVNLLAISNCRT